MRVAIHGHVNQPAAAVVGTWDPLLPSHIELFESLAASAHNAGRCAVVVMIDPDPVQFLWSPTERPSFDDWRVRAEIARAAGVDAVARLHFLDRDVDAIAADLFQALIPRIPLAELWLGARQSFGRGPGGAGLAIAAEAERYGFREVRLPPAKRTAIEGNVVRRLLMTGQLRAAAEMVGRSAVRARPRSGRLSVAWPAGVYHAVPLASPLEPCAHRPIQVRFVAGRGGRTELCWPVAAPYLAFTHGPGDELATIARKSGEEKRIAS